MYRHIPSRQRRTSTTCYRDFVGEDMKWTSSKRPTFEMDGSEEVMEVWDLNQLLVYVAVLLPWNNWLS